MGDGLHVESALGAGSIPPLQPLQSPSFRLGSKVCWLAGCSYVRRTNTGACELAAREQLTWNNSTLGFIGLLYVPLCDILDIVLGLTSSALSHDPSVTPPQCSTSQSPPRPRRCLYPCRCIAWSSVTPAAHPARATTSPPASWLLPPAGHSVELPGRSHGPPCSQPWRRQRQHPGGRRRTTVSGRAA